jgi:PAT family beta-lactamase induction signal transducer AmpG
MQRWLAAAAVYLNPRVVAILFLGFSSGLPLGLSGQTLSVWLKEEGVSLTTIGLFALVGLPYVLKFLWAPVIDAVRIPYLTRRLGRRRAWLITTQAALMGAVVVLGVSEPATRPLVAAALALVVAFCSASQDIVVDAFRVESLDEPQFAAGMANYVAGYRVAMLAATFGSFELAAVLQDSGLAGSAGWALTYAVMAALVLVGVVTVLLSREPAAPADVDGDRPFGERFADAVVSPFVDFMKRPGWLLILLFVMLFKFGDAFAGVMTAPFVLDIGFDKTDYGRVVKVFGFAATLIGGFAGGYVYRAAGAVASLWIAGLVQMASNLMFVWQASAGAEMGLLFATIAIENLAGGLGTVIFVAYLSGLCENRRYTATQYALLSALSAVGRTVLSASAGWFAEVTGWVPFFLLTTAAALPGLALLWWITRPGAATRPAAVTRNVLTEGTADPKS